MGRRGRDWISAIAVSALGLGVMLAGAEGAAAGGGRYHVYSCRMPNGQVAPTDGWSPSATGAAVYAEDKCAKGGALVAALGDGVTHAATADVATWTFESPAGETLAAATLWRAGDADGTMATNATYQFWLSAPSQSKVFDECVYEFGCQMGRGEQEQPMSMSNRISVPTSNLGANVYVNASCGGIPSYSCPSGKGDTNGYAAVVYLYAADLLLEQSSSPTVVPGSVSGELATASTVSGRPTLLFEAKDSGSGVYQAVVTVDEKVLGATTLDSNGGHCVSVGQTADGLPAFLYLRPCALSVSADVPLDTTALANGAHRAVVAVTDAAGNSTVVLDRVINVSNAVPSQSLVTTASNAPTIPQNNPAPQPQPTNGANATALALLSARWSSSSKPALRSRYGRAQTILGRLLAPGGAPIAGALLEATITPASQGAHSSALASIRIAADGTFRLRLPSSVPSSTIGLAYRSVLGSPVPSVTATLSLVVPASLTLRVTPRVSHVHGTIRFSGVLRGGPIPPGGKQLVLQAASPGSSWRTFEAVSTDRRGRYRASYRFRYPGPASYRFRAVSPAEADFPFATGGSRVVRVRER
jgi:hypothetical protein